MNQKTIQSNALKANNGRKEIVEPDSRDHH